MYICIQANRYKKNFIAISSFSFHRVQMEMEFFFDCFFLFWEYKPFNIFHRGISNSNGDSVDESQHQSVKGHIYVQLLGKQRWIDDKIFREHFTRTWWNETYARVNEFIHCFSIFIITVLDKTPHIDRLQFIHCATSILLLESTSLSKHFLCVCVYWLCNHLNSRTCFNLSFINKYLPKISEQC